MHTSKPARSQNLARAIALRFPPGVTAKLDALARQRTRDEGTLVTRSDVVREIVHRALTTETQTGGTR